MPMLARLRASYPGITVSLRLGNAQETLAALLSEHVDVAVLTEVEARPGLFLEELVNSRICALLPRQHPWCERSEGVPLEELDQQIMVLREPGSITAAPSTAPAPARACSRGCCWSWTAGKR